MIPPENGNIFNPSIFFPEFVEKANILVTRLCSDLRALPIINQILGCVNRLIGNVCEEVRAPFEKALQGSVPDIACILSGYARNPDFMRYGLQADQELKSRDRTIKPFVKATLLRDGFDLNTEPRLAKLNELLKALFPVGTEDVLRKIVEEIPVYVLDEMSQFGGYADHGLVYLSGQGAESFNRRGVLGELVLVHELMHVVFDRYLQIDDNQNHFTDYRSNLVTNEDSLQSNTQANEIVAHAISFYVNSDTTLKLIFNPEYRNESDYWFTIKIIEQSVDQVLGVGQFQILRARAESTNSQLYDLLVEALESKQITHNFAQTTFDNFVAESRNLIQHRLVQLAV